MINSYGLFWHIDRVYWGKQKDPGTLLGAASQSNKAMPVDFREQRGIYALYGSYNLVYIGQTGTGDQRLFNRLKAHKSDHLSERWDRFSWFGIKWVTKVHVLSKDADSIHCTLPIGLNMLEAVAIAISEPILNIQRGRWGEAKQYYQYCNNEPS